MLLSEVIREKSQKLYQRNDGVKPPNDNEVPGYV